MRDLTKNYELWIKGFTKDQFDVLVKSYIKSIWKLTEVIFVDGSHDGGIDLKVFENNKKKKIPIQVTIDKNTYTKLERDLPKIEKLITDHCYSDTMFFFYNGSSAEDKLSDLEEIAKSEFGINLNIIDCKIIAGLTESNPLIKQTIHETLNLQYTNQIIFNVFEKLKYDLLSFGSETSEIKERIAEAHILQYLYENKEVKIDDLKQNVMKCFEFNDNVNFCERQFSKLRTKKKIDINENNVKLNELEFKKIENLKQNIDIEEKVFIGNIIKILTSYNLQDSYIEIISRLRKFYETNNEKDISDINSDFDKKDFELQAIEEFRHYINEKTSNNKKNTELLIKEILNYCEECGLLRRLEAGSLFSKLTNSTLLTAYLNRQPKPIFLDTQLLLYMLCVFYNPRTKYKNVYFQIATDFYNYFQRGEIKLKLHTSKNYVKEIAYHIEDAFKLIPFIENDLFKYFGGTTRNVFLNFYNYLKENEQLEYGINSFKDFMCDLGVTSNIYDENYINTLIEDIEYILQTNSIKVISLKEYEKIAKWKAIYSETKRKLEEIYISGILNRSENTLRNDLQMLLFLFDEKMHNIEPTFVTWDNTFFEIRKEYHNKHASAFFWHLFRPAKMLDHFSLINLKINSKNISQSVLSIIENDYDIHGRVKTIQDVLLRILDLSTASGIKLAKEIKDIRKNHIYDLNSKQENENIFNEAQPIDFILIRISDYFIKKQSQFKLKELKNALSNENTIDQILELLKIELKFYKEKKKVNPNLGKNIDKIIEANLNKK